MCFVYNKNRIFFISELQQKHSLIFVRKKKKVKYDSGANRVLDPK